MHAAGSARRRCTRETIETGGGCPPRVIGNDSDSIPNRRYAALASITKSATEAMLTDLLDRRLFPAGAKIFSEEQPGDRA
jgi:hypothetical protein